MIRRDVFMRQSFGGCYPFPGIEDEHLVQEIKGFNIDVRFRAKLRKDKDSSPVSSVVLNFCENGTRCLFGRLWTNLKVFSEAMVAITSSGGVPSSSVMIENWWTSVG
jgi:hypothetical protein